MLWPRALAGALMLLAANSFAAAPVAPVAGAGGLPSGAPLDIDAICDSVERTGRLLVVDTAWTNCGAAAEIVARVAERLGGLRDLRLKLQERGEL